MREEEERRMRGGWGRWGRGDEDERMRWGRGENGMRKRRQLDSEKRRIRWGDEEERWWADARGKNEKTLFSPPGFELATLWLSDHHPTITPTGFLVSSSIQDLYISLYTDSFKKKTEGGFESRTLSLKFSILDTLPKRLFLPGVLNASVYSNKKSWN